MNERINDWAPETKALLNRLVAAGCTLLSGDNGEERFEFTGDLPAFIENLIACDEARLYVQTPSSIQSKWLYLVLGNSPGELASDYICDPVLDAVTDAHYNEWSEKAQPMRDAR